MASPRIGFARASAKSILKELKISSPPIRLADIVKYLGYQVTPRDFDDGLSGVQITSPQDCFIAYNNNFHVHRKRFTVAHEIGHSILGHTSLNDQEFDLNSQDTNEVEANQFAAELLVPLNMLKKDVGSGIKSTDQLAIRYWVSKDAMGWRLLETRLFKNLNTW